MNLDMMKHASKDSEALNGKNNQSCFQYYKLFIYGKLQ